MPMWPVSETDIGCIHIQYYKELGFYNTSIMDR